jgi:hypothetical protein
MLCISLKIVKIHVTAHTVFVLVLGRATINVNCLLVGLN